MPSTDVVIIGAGPVGLFAAFYTGMRDLTMRLIDPLPEAGGQLTALYPEKYIYDVAGYPQVRAKELVLAQVKQLEPFHPVYTLEERAEKLERTDSGWRVVTDKNTYETKAVIVAGGVGANSWPPAFQNSRAKASRMPSKSSSITVARKS